VRISSSNAGYTMFRGTGYTLHSPVAPSLLLPCVSVCHHISTGLYNTKGSILLVADYHFCKIVPHRREVPFADFLSHRAHAYICRWEEKHFTLHQNIDVKKQPLPLAPSPFPPLSVQPPPSARCKLVFS
jgi:hypothetical protein